MAAPHFTENDQFKMSSVCFSIVVSIVTLVFCSCGKPLTGDVVKQITSFDAASKPPSSEWTGMWKGGEFGHKMGIRLEEKNGVVLGLFTEQMVDTVKMYKINFLNSSSDKLYFFVQNPLSSFAVGDVLDQLLQLREDNSKHPRREFVIKLSKPNRGNLYHRKLEQGTDWYLWGQCER